MTRLASFACIGVVLYIVAVTVGVVFYIVVGAVAVVFVVCFLDQVLCSRDVTIGVISPIGAVLRILGFRGFFRVLGFLSYFGVLNYLGYLGVLREVAVGVVVGGVVVAVGFLLFLLVIGVVEVGKRRAVQVPAHLRTGPVLAPKTLRWVRGLLPGDEGAAWLAEVGSCLAETTDKGERRRYVRSYRRKIPQLIWTSWTEHLSASRQRELL
jgi:hypothetical protein